MKAKILSLNVGHPKDILWEGRKIRSSMDRSPIEGPLKVYLLRISGDSFATPAFHGTPDSVLYAYGLPSVMKLMRLLGKDKYEPGSLGENLTLDAFEETEISVGDIFRIGEVEVQATGPRIPCGKVNYRVGHKEGQKLMQQAGCSGVYFRVLKVGQIQKADEVLRISQSDEPFLISEMYRLFVEKGRDWPAEFRERARKNGAFPAGLLEKW